MGTSGSLGLRPLDLENRKGQHVKTSPLNIFPQKDSVVLALRCRPGRTACSGPAARSPGGGSLSGRKAQAVSSGKHVPPNVFEADLGVKTSTQTCEVDSVCF